MDFYEFNDYYINNILHKVSSDHESVMFLRYCNVKLMKYDNHHPINEFLIPYPQICFFLMLHNQLEKEILAKH